jgi:parvulin-like peptidyl-prolyl isomerase
MKRTTTRRSIRPVPFLTAALLLAASIAVGCGGSGDEALPEAGVEGVDTTSAEQELLESLRAPEPDKVIAAVNGKEIRAGKVYEVAALNLMNLQAQGRNLDEQEEKNLRMQVLELIINDELMAQEAEQMGLAVTEQEIDAQVAAVREQHGTQAAFEQVLADAGLGEDEFRGEVARRLLSQKFVERITQDVKVTDEEARTVYERYPERFSEGETVEVRQILIRSLEGDPEPKRAAAEERAREAYGRAVAGEDFAELAREYSQAPNAPDGGLVTHFPRGVMVPRFEEVAFSLGPGEISDVFETSYGYNIVQVTDRKDATLLPYAEIKPKLMVDLAQAKESLLVQMTIRTLQEQANVEVFDPDFYPGDAPGGGEGAADDEAGSVGQG